MDKKWIITFSIISSLSIGLAASSFTVLVINNSNKNNANNDADLTFDEAIRKTNFVKPQKIDDVIKKEEGDTEEKILELLKQKWSRNLNPDVAQIQIEKVNTEHVVTVNQNTNIYCKNIFGKKWEEIIDQTNNKEVKDIRQVNYGFRLNKKSDNKWEMIPTYVQFSFNNKPTWLEPEKDTYRIPLIGISDLISIITLI